MRQLPLRPRVADTAGTAAIDCGLVIAVVAMLLVAALPGLRHDLSGWFGAADIAVQSGRKYA